MTVIYMQKIKAGGIATVGILSAMMVLSQVAFSFLPNIELVSLFVILFTLNFRRKTLYAIYIFALLEGLIYGFGLWWIMYLYVWTILYLIVRVFRHMTEPIAWAILSGIFGLSFGALCSIPYFFISGLGGGIAYFVSGIFFDIVHCIGNFAAALFLLKPLDTVITKLRVSYLMDDSKGEQIHIK